MCVGAFSGNMCQKEPWPRHRMPWENRVVPLDCIARCSTATGGIREQKLQLHSNRQPSLVGLLSWSPAAHGHLWYDLVSIDGRDQWKNQGPGNPGNRILCVFFDVSIAAYLVLGYKTQFLPIHLWCHSIMPWCVACSAQPARSNVRKEIAPKQYLMLYQPVETFLYGV